MLHGAPSHSQASPSRTCPILKRIHLLACGHCKRQLDVTALEVGDEIQCVCNTVHVVGEPKLVQVRGLACGRCGGVLEEEDTSCSFCKAALAPEEREKTTLCPVCATRLPNDSNHCNNCGVSLRIAAVPALPKDGACPRCQGNLRIHLLEDAEVVECGSCGGMWCSRETFERMIQNVRKAVKEGSIGGPVAPPPPLSIIGPSFSMAQFEGYVPCFTCGDFMSRRQFRHEGKPSRIIIDVCRNHGVWFDQAELEGILAFIQRELTNAGRIDLPYLDWASTGPSESAPPSPSNEAAANPSKKGSLTFTASDTPLEVFLHWVADFFIGH